MKYAIALSILLAASASATTSNFSKTVGSTTVIGIGQSTAVTNYSGTHVQNSGHIFNGSHQVETVEGKVKSDSYTSFNAHTSFKELSANLNGADFGYESGKTAGSSVTGVYTNGREVATLERDNWQWSPGGNSNESYSEQTVTKSNESATINSNYVTDYVGYRAYQ